MALFGNLLAQLQDKAGGGDLANALAQMQGGQPAMPQGDSLIMMALREQLGGQQAAPTGGSPLMQQVAQGAQPAQASQAMALMGGMAQPQQGSLEQLVQQFRQMFGRDPMNQQELAMVGGPAVSQMMG